MEKSSKVKFPIYYYITYLLRFFFSEMVIEDAPGCEENRLSQLILEQDGTHEDLLLSNQIVQYVCQKEVVGATGMELKVKLLCFSTKLKYYTIYYTVKQTFK